MVVTIHLLHTRINNRVYHVHLDDDVVAELGAGDVHVLVGVVAADDGRGGAAGRGHGEGVINTVTWGAVVTTHIR